jgi:uncharacterized RDD family membrane protein YckC
MTYLLTNYFWAYVAGYSIACSLILILALIEMKRLIGDGALSAPLFFSGQLRAAGVSVRILAQIVDVMIAIFLAWFLDGVLLAILEKLGVLSVSMNKWIEFNFWWLFIASIIPIHFLHSTIATALYGRTLGKLLLRVEVQSLDGRLLRHQMAVGRYVLYLLFISSAGYGFIDLALNKQKQGFHDRICKTRVVYTGVPNPGVMFSILFIFFFFLTGMLHSKCGC